MTAPEIPAEIVEAAAHAIFADEQCDKRQAKDVPYQWNTRLNEADHEEYRALARAALAAVWPLIAAHVLNEAADAWQSGEWANAPRRADRVQERIANGQHVGDWLRARAATQTPKEIQ